MLEVLYINKARDRNWSRIPNYVTTVAQAKIVLNNLAPKWLDIDSFGTELLAYISKNSYQYIKTLDTTYGFTNLNIGFNSFKSSKHLTTNTYIELLGYIEQLNSSSNTNAHLNFNYEVDSNLVIVLDKLKTNNINIDELTVKISDLVNLQSRGLLDDNIWQQISNPSLWSQYVLLDLAEQYHSLKVTDSVLSNDFFSTMNFIVQNAGNVALNIPINENINRSDIIIVNKLSLLSPVQLSSFAINYETLKILQENSLLTDALWSSILAGDTSSVRASLVTNINSRWSNYVPIETSYTSKQYDLILAINKAFANNEPLNFKGMSFNDLTSKYAELSLLGLSAYDLILVFGQGQVVHFKDNILEQKIRQVLGLTNDQDILYSDLLSITELDLSGLNISSLEGIKYLSNLVSLNLSNNNISDISELSFLKKLQVLNLSNNRIISLSSLYGLTTLTSLNIENNSMHLGTLTADGKYLVQLTKKGINLYYQIGNTVVDTPVTVNSATSLVSANTRKNYLQLTGSKFFEESNGVLKVYTEDGTTLLASTTVSNGVFSVQVPLTNYLYQGKYLSKVKLDFIPNNQSLSPVSYIKNTIVDEAQHSELLSYLVSILGSNPLGITNNNMLKIKSVQDVIFKILPIIQDKTIKIANLPSLEQINEFYENYDDIYFSQSFDIKSNKYKAEDSLLIAYIMNNPNEFEFYFNYFLSNHENSLSLKDKAMLLFNNVDKEWLWDITKVPDYASIEAYLDSIRMAYVLDYKDMIPGNGDDLMVNVIRDDINYYHLARMIQRVFKDRRLDGWNIPNIGNFGYDFLWTIPRNGFIGIGRLVHPYTLEVLNPGLSYVDSFYIFDYLQQNGYISTAGSLTQKYLDLGMPSLPQPYTDKTQKVADVISNYRNNNSRWIGMDMTLEQKISLSFLVLLSKQQPDMRENFTWKGRQIKVPLTLSGNNIYLGAYDLPLIEAKKAEDIFSALLTGQSSQVAKYILDLSIFTEPALTSIDSTIDYKESGILSMGAFSLQNVDMPAPADSVFSMPFMRNYNHRSLTGRLPVNKAFEYKSLLDLSEDAKASLGTNLFTLYHQFGNYDVSKLSLFNLGKGWSSNFDLIGSSYYKDNEKDSSEFMKNFSFKINGSILSFDENMNIVNTGVEAKLKEVNGDYVVTMGDVSYVFQKIASKSGQKRDLRFRWFLDRYVDQNRHYNAGLYFIKEIKRNNYGTIKFNYLQEAEVSNSDSASSGTGGGGADEYNWSTWRKPSRLANVTFYNNNGENKGEISFCYASQNMHDTNGFDLTTVSSKGLHGETNSTNYKIVDGLLRQFTNVNSDVEDYEYSMYSAGTLLLDKIKGKDGLQRKVIYSYNDELRDVYEDPEYRFFVSGDQVTVNNKTYSNYKNYTTSISSDGTNNKYINNEFILDRNTGDFSSSTSYKGMPTEIESSNGVKKSFKWDIGTNNLIEAIETFEKKKTTTNYSNYDINNNPHTITQLMENGDSGNASYVSKNIRTELNYKDELKLSLGITPPISSKKVFVNNELVSFEENTYNTKGLQHTKTIHNIGENIVQPSRDIVLTYLYNDDNLVKSIVLANWDKEGNLQSEEQVLVHSRAGNILTVTRADSSNTNKQEIDINTGLVLAEIDANNFRTEYEYDYKNRVSRVKYPNNALVKTDYCDDYFAWEGQQVRKVVLTNPLNQEVVKFYNQLGKLVYIDNPNNLPDEYYEYDSRDRLSKKTLLALVDGVEEKNITRYDYSINEPNRVEAITMIDDKGNLLARINNSWNNSLGETYVNDHTGLSKTYKEAISGELESYTSSMGDNVSLIKSPNQLGSTVSDNLNQNYDYFFSSTGQLDKSVENGLTHIMSYDARQNLLKHSVGTTNNTVFENKYDLTGRQTDINFGANNFKFGYDSVLAGTEGLSLTNTKGRLAWVKYNDQVERLRSYDNMGAVQKELLKINTNYQSLNYHHDVMGTLDKISLNDGREVRYGFNTLGQLESINIYNPTTQATQELKHFYYDGWGRMSRVTLNSGHEIKFQYDAKHRLYREETKYGGVTQGFKQYEYNQREIISDIKMLNANQVVTKHDHYEYDAQGQLELARKIVGQNTEEHKYNFDLNSNRVFVKRPNEVKKVTILEPNSNRIDKIVNESNGVLIDLTWDSQGRLKEKMDYENNKKYVFTFNELDKLTEIKVYDTSNVQLGAVLTEHLVYEYYSTGLMKKQQNVITSTNEFYIYDKHNNLIQVQDQSGHSDKTYIYAGSTRIGHTDNAGIVTLYKNDHLGSKTGEYNSNGTITEQQDFSPFGLPKNAGEASYTGKFYSNKTEMYFFNSRWYDPELGIFISEDPVKADITDPLTLNTYAFVKNNPIMNIDQDGEFFKEIFGYFFPGLGDLIGGALDAVVASNIARTGFNISQWEFNDKVFYSALATGGLAMFNIKVDTGSGFFNDWLDESVNSGLGSLATTGNFDQGAKTGFHDYLANRALSGASASWDWYDYNILPKDMKNFIPDGFEGIIAATRLDTIPFEHFQVFDLNGNNFGVLGKDFDIESWLMLKPAQYGELAQKDLGRKYRVIGYVKKINPSKTEGAKFPGYNLLWNNCVHGAYSQ